MEREITALKQQKRNPKRVNVYLDGEFAFGLAKIVAAWLEVGQKLGPERIRELEAKDAVEAAYQRALNYLSYRPRSINEVQRNLSKHDVSEAVSDEVIERLKEQRFVDDFDFAQRWVENRNTFRPRGKFALRAELRQKGVEDAIIDKALQDLDEEELAWKASQKKMRRYRELEWPDFRKKLSAYLARRGFSYALIAEICQQAWQRVEQDKLSQ